MGTLAAFDTPAGITQRKSDPSPPTEAAAVERRGDVWYLRSYRAVRQVLRDADATRQAGFNAELARRSSLRQPVLFQDGAEHREQRTAIARFFTPKTVEERYRTLMTELADALVDDLRAAGGGAREARHRDAGGAGPHVVVLSARRAPCDRGAPP